MSTTGVVRSSRNVKSRKQPLISVERESKLKKLQHLAPPANMSGRQMMYCYARAHGLGKKESAVAAGYSVTGNNWGGIEKSEAVRKYMRQLAEQAGITPQLIMSKLRDGLDATSTKEFCSRYGDLVRGDERVDFPTRLEYLRTTCSMLGFDASRIQESTDGNTVNILVLAENYHDMPRDQLLDNLQKLRLGIVTNKNVHQEIKI